MSLLRLLIATAILCASAAATAQTPSEPAMQMHRYLIERSFPAGALDTLDADASARIIANNKASHVHWKMSYVNADKTRTYCIYEAPDAEAVRQAAKLNGLPVDSITEIPGTLSPPSG